MSEGTAKSGDAIDELVRLRARVAELEKEAESYRREAERFALRDEVLNILAESPTLSEAGPRILQVMCEMLRFSGGVLWVTEPRGDSIRCAEIWESAPGAAGDPAPVRGVHLRRGSGLPGRVLASGQSLRGDLDPGTRKGSLGIPVLFHKAVLAVIELLNGDIPERGPELLEALSRLGSQIGRFVRRKYTEESLERFFTLSIDMLCVAGYDGYFRWLNPAWTRTLGYTFEELTRVPFLDFVHPDDRAATLSEVQKLSEGHLTISFENRYRAKDGEYRWLQWNSAPFKQHQLIYAVARDVTEHRRSEESIHRLRDASEAANRAKTEFLARMSHEIRTPLHVVIGMGELLDRTPLNAEQRQYVRVFQRAGNNLLALINDVLDLAKVESGRIILESAGFDLAEIIDATVEMMELRAREKGIHLDHWIAPETPAQLTGDAGRLRQVLINLLGNAIKFTEKGEVRLSVEPDPEATSPGALLFTISDTGIGIPAGKLDTIFEAFTQVDPSTTRQHGGTGLGLAIARRFVELMQGRIWAESAPGQGATFRFTAKFGVEPRVNSPEATLEPDIPYQAKRAPSPSGLRILVAEDSDENQFVVSEYLKDTDYRLDFVNNGQMAVEKFRSGEYDAVLMDLQMPVLDGYAATAQMREWERQQGRAATPILALTASALDSELDHALQVGCTTCLRKPIRRQTLIDAIGKYAVSPARGSAEPRLQICSDPRLREAVPGYLAKRAADVERIREALGRSDYDKIREVGHKMAGTGTAYGFTEITAIGADLERWARERNSEAIRESAARLAGYLERIEPI